ncbi:hypothetical protein BJX64DRAFT_287220 [Aspergillus heterothallicus]
MNMITNNPRALLESYISERRAVAQQLLDIDERWYQFEWAQESSKNEKDYSEKREELLASITGFLAGYGVHYNNSFLTRQSTHNASKGQSNSCFIPRFRIKPMALERFADGLSCNLLDDLRLDGRWKLLLLANGNFLHPNSRARRAIQALFDSIIPRFPRGIITPTVITPGRVNNGVSKGHAVSMKDLEWSSFPLCVKREAEMKTYFTTSKTHELDIGDGKIVLVRPEGVVSLIVELDDVITTGHLAEFLESVVRSG